LGRIRRLNRIPYSVQSAVMKGQPFVSPTYSCGADKHMRGHLFYDDGAIAVAHLRSLARREVACSSLIRRAAGGDRKAAEQLHLGFWPFVREFELAIDRRHLPRAPLVKKFGASASRTFVHIAKSVREMKDEEGSHASHWRADAGGLGLPSLEAPPLPLVRQLTDSAYTANVSKFFSVLAGTEFIAEELSAYLVASPEFTCLFNRKRWVWGEIHLMPHEDVSHLDIDLDLARAYAQAESTRQIETWVADTISLFGRAAEQVLEAS
jgi:hypothetical protein